MPETGQTRSSRGICRPFTSAAVCPRALQLSPSSSLSGRIVSAGRARAGGGGGGREPSGLVSPADTSACVSSSSSYSVHEEVGGTLGVPGCAFWVQVVRSGCHAVCHGGARPSCLGCVGSVAPPGRPGRMRFAMCEQLAWPSLSCASGGSRSCSSLQRRCTTHGPALRGRSGDVCASEGMI